MATIAPARIGQDTYAGRHWRRGVPTGRRVGEFTAAEVAGRAPTGVIWESFGHVRDGREGFCRSRYVADDAGNLHIYSASGDRVLVHPAARVIRVLAAAPPEARQTGVHATAVRRVGADMQYTVQALCACGWASRWFVGDRRFADRAVAEACTTHEREPFAARAAADESGAGTL